jgi:hypothetical protein
MSNNSLQSLVRRQIILTNSRFLTFSNLYAKLQIGLPDTKTINEAFEQLKNSNWEPSMKENFSKNSLDLILMIHAEYERAEDGFKQRVCGPNGFTIYRNKFFDL